MKMQILQKLEPKTFLSHTVYEFSLMYEGVKLSIILMKTINAMQTQ